jgi:HAD superfamily hydrolase (TIGR01548 family)
MNKPLLVFDMDGVLVDVTGSYRETIAQTVDHFTGVKAARERIQELKNQGGWNDDWKLSHHLVAEAGVEAPFEEVKARFQFLLQDLMQHERWVAQEGTLEELNQNFNFAVFTGRPRDEAEMSLRRFAPGLVFDPVICTEDVENHKPHPEGLLRIVERHGARGPEARALPSRDREGAVGPPVFYIGDTVDDARCARAARVPFIGIAAPSNPLYLDLVFLFQGEGAYAIVDDINYLREVFTS